jgi:lipopolysaccharide export system permease protein
MASVTDAALPGRSFFPRLRLLDRYMLKLLSEPAATCLGVTLIAMLLERVLRLINEMAATGAHFSFMFGLVTNLVPYYLGLALPASFFISLFIVVSRLDNGSEIDVMLASGRSLTRIAGPLIAVGCVLGVISIILFGFLEPYGRYGYRAVQNAAVNAGWTAVLQPQVFLSPGQGITISADQSDASGRKLKGPFLRRLTPEGVETVVTASTGVLSLNPDGKTTRMELSGGVEYSDAPNQAGRVLRFQHIGAAQALGIAPKLRARGGDAKELTIFEIIHEMRSHDKMISMRSLQAELYERLARAFAMPLLPLMALPLGMATKRGRRAPGLIVAGVVLVAFHHGVAMAKNLASQGDADPLIAIGGLFAAFAAFTCWLFFFSTRPGQTPLSGILETLQVLLDKLPKRSKVQAKARRASRIRGIGAYVRHMLTIRTLAALAAMIALLQLVDLLDHMADILGRGLGAEGVLKYAVLRLPAMAEQICGIAMLVGGVFTFLQLGRNSEIVAMRATGLSTGQIVRMALPVAVLVAACDLVVADQLTPRAQQELATWWTATTPKTAEAKQKPQWFRAGGDLVLAQSASIDGSRLKEVRLYMRTQNKQLTRRVLAKSAISTPQGWRLEDAVVTEIGLDRAVTVRAPGMVWHTALTPPDVARLFSPSYLISSTTAWRSLQGQGAINQSPAFFRTRLHRVFAEPLGVLIMLLMAIPVSLATFRNGRTVPLVLYGLGGGLLYLVVDGLLTALGQTGALPPFIAGWTAPVLFGCAAIAVLLYAED